MDIEQVNTYLCKKDVQNKFKKIMDRTPCVRPVFVGKPLNPTPRKMCVEVLKSLNEHMSFFRITNTCSDRWLLLDSFKKFLRDKLDGINDWRPYPEEKPEIEGRYLIVARPIGWEKGVDPREEVATKNVIYDPNRTSAEYDGAFWNCDYGYADNDVLFWQPYPKIPERNDIDLHLKKGE